ncbi:hypothetical protein THAOC_19304, partial [Thalassiosira oceanica]
LSKGVAQNYRTIDKETFNFIDAVAKSLLKRSRKLKAKAESKSLPREILVPSSPNVNMAHVPASIISVPVPSMTVAMTNQLKLTPSELEKKTTPPQHVETARGVSQFRGWLGYQQR